MVYWHMVNGRRYTSLALETAPESLAAYKALVRKVYGSLVGVKFGIEATS